MPDNDGFIKDTALRNIELIAGVIEDRDALSETVCFIKEEHPDLYKKFRYDASHFIRPLREMSVEEQPQP